MNKMYEEIEACKTEKQLKEVLNKYDIKVVRDDSEEFGTVSVWIDENTRIYKPYRRKGTPEPFMKVQKWQRIEAKYSGAPMFSNNPSMF